MFPQALVTHLQMEASDHCLILIKTINLENKEGCLSGSFRLGLLNPHLFKLFNKLGTRIKGLE